MAKTTISVALCTYNGEKYLAEQLDSILSQENPVDEIVVCDDGSTDNTQSILQDYQARFPELFRIFINEKNLGYVANFEKALSLCTGDLIFLCDQDDIWHQDKVKFILHYFKENPLIGVAAHNLDLIGTYDGNKTFWELKNFHSETKPSNQELLQHILSNGNIFPGMSLAIRKKTLHDYLPLQKIDSILIHDYELIIKALRDEQFGLIPKNLGAYRQHDQQSIGFRENEKSQTSELTKIQLRSEHYLRLQKYTTAFNLTPKIAADYRQEIKDKYSLFLKEFSFPNRMVIHLKNKYYYKILHF